MQCSPSGGRSFEVGTDSTLGCPGGNGVFFACGTGHLASSAATTSADDAMVAGVRKPLVDCVT